MKENYIMKVRNPRSIQRIESPTGLFAPRPETLDGKRIAIIPEKFDSDIFFEMLEKLISDKYPTATISRVQIGFMDKPEKLVEKVAGNYDVWLEGVKTSGAWEMDRLAALEKAGVPGVTISIDELAPQRRRLAAMNGMPALRIATLSAERFFTTERSCEKIMDIAKDAFDDILHALTDPITEAEKNPVLPEYDYSDLCFEGCCYSEANDKLQSYFAEHDLTDGLAIVPPTEEAVMHMLSGTSLDSKKEIGILAPGRGVATVEKVAINAVMAGAKPEYLPVIIAAVEALVDPAFDEHHIQVCVASTSTLIAVNGPIAKELGMNGKTAYLSPGNRANSTIGRAVSLCLINIGWAIERFEGKWTGTANRYCNITFCENEEDSPWNSYAAEYGFAPEECTVTVDEIMTIERGPAGTMFTAPLEEDLKSLSKMVRAFVHSDGDNSPKRVLNQGITTLLIFPAQARQFAAAGYSKEALKNELCNRHRKTWDDFDSDVQAQYLELAKEGHIPLLSIDDCKSGGTVPTVNRNRLRIYVVGSMAGTTLGMYGIGNYNNINRGFDYKLPPFNTKKIRGATLTKAGK